MFKNSKTVLHPSLLSLIFILILPYRIRINKPLIALFFFSFLLNLPFLNPQNLSAQNSNQNIPPENLSKNTQSYANPPSDPNPKLNQELQKINLNNPSPPISEIDEVAKLNLIFGKIFDFPLIQVPLLILAILILSYMIWKRKVYWIIGIPISMTLSGLLFLFVFLEIKNMGYNYGYQPVQPIKFSHNLHVKKNKIACTYCHFNAEKSKHATIPTANLCMNCHSVIRTESAEIQKIYQAIEQNRSIQWVKVHHVADFVYFNHSQHVKVGGSAIIGKKIETSDDVKAVCQTCHGSVESMTTAKQSTSMSMGWCIECHKKTPSPSNPKKTVADLGGNNCYKCHH